ACVRNAAGVAARSRDGRLAGALERGVIADLDDLPARRVTEPLEASGLGGDAAGVHGEERDARAALREGFGDGEAEAAARAGDERGLACDVEELRALHARSPGRRPAAPP